jgi:hypothetical protein
MSVGNNTAPKEENQQQYSLTQEIKMPDTCGMCNATTAAAAVEGEGQGSSPGRMMKCGKCKQQRYCSQYG